MNKQTDIESLIPGSGRYSLLTDLKLNAWLAVTMALYLTGNFLLRGNPDWGFGVRCMVKLAPFAPLMLYIASWAQFVQRLDELQRRVQIDAFLFASLGTGLLAAVLHTLTEQGARVTWMPLGIGIGGFLFSMALLWPVGYAIANCRYK